MRLEWDDGRSEKGQGSRGNQDTIREWEMWKEYKYIGWLLPFPFNQTGYKTGLNGALLLDLTHECS